MDKDIAIRGSSVGKTFKLPNEKASTIKGAIVNFWKRDKGYEKFEALKDVSFEVQRGEFFGIVGRNGSGKSTLLKLLAGIYVPTKGSIYVDGKLTPFIELGVGFNPELTGRENVFLNGSLMGFNRKEMAKMYSDIVEFAELERFMDQKLKNYSSGMLVRLAFSIAIRVKSDILLLDEVLAVGDTAFQVKCQEYFRNVKNSNKTVVLVTHDMSAVTKYCDRAMLINNGEIEIIGNPKIVADAYDEINREKNAQSDKKEKIKATLNKTEKYASIVEYKIEDEKGISRNWFKANEQMNISVTYKLKKDIKNLSIDVGLTLGSNGLLFFYYDSGQKVKQSGKEGEVFTIKCSVDNIFAEDTYYIVTSLYDFETKEVYARNRKLGKIRTSKLPFSGIVAPSFSAKVVKD